MSKVVALPPGDEEAVIRSRFLTQASVSRGEPPLKKLTKRFVELCDKAEKGSDKDTEEALHALYREISSVEVQVQKQNATCAANIREQATYEQKQRQLEGEIEQARLDIEAKKKELQEARVVRQHMAEYEVLRHIIAESPARAQTQKEIDRVKNQTEGIRKEGAKFAQMMQRRRKQFALLFHVIEELQRTANGDDQEAATAVAADGNDGQQQMELDG